MIVKKPLKCVHYDREECAKNGDTECVPTIKECEEQAHCFGVWNHDNVTGGWIVCI